MFSRTRRADLCRAAFGFISQTRAPVLSCPRQTKVFRAESFTPKVVRFKLRLASTRDKHSASPNAEQSSERATEEAKIAMMRILSRRPASSSELLDKVYKKGYSEEAALAALGRLQELELQSDSEYAEIFARSKWRQSVWAPRRIRKELRTRGLDEEVVDNVGPPICPEARPP
mmetsp:Transcript_31952/g.75915  ORF Transcript_31952/g.75915 Transcript_31952/m.75915 type:complete len:173 (+) Transcript_31952:278-796(+)